MNYNTIVTPEEGLPCTKQEADEIEECLGVGEDDELHGFTVDFEDGLMYLVAEESGSWSQLPAEALEKVGALIRKAEKPYWEFGAAFTASRMVPGSHGGTAFRIMADGTVVDRTETWGPT